MQKHGQIRNREIQLYETWSLTVIFGQLKWESLKKRRKDIRLFLICNHLKPGKNSLLGKAILLTNYLIQLTGAEETTTRWHFRLLQLAQVLIKAEG